jgi:ferritin-like metal-binding protein YciE
MDRVKLRSSCRPNSSRPRLAATLEEEEATDEALTEIAKTAINQEAQVA